MAEGVADAVTPEELLVHWESVYRTKATDQVSWFQREAERSQALIEQLVPSRDAAIIDVGAGASTLVDGLVAAGYHNITLLDLSPAALAITRQRLGASGASVHAIAGDVRSVELPADTFDLWHDRALFHFLTAPADRRRYVERLRHALRPGGHVVMATFALDGPTRCSGLDVVRYSPETLRRELGDDFELVAGEAESHQTPSGGAQRFAYGVYRRSC